MTSYISTSLRQLINDRAGGKCEYCLIHQDFSIYSHEVDHAVAIKHGGASKTRQKRGSRTARTSFSNLRG